MSGLLWKITSRIRSAWSRRRSCSSLSPFNWKMIIRMQVIKTTLFDPNQIGIVFSRRKLVQHYLVMLLHSFCNTFHKIYLKIERWCGWRWALWKCWPRSAWTPVNLVNLDPAFRSSVHQTDFDKVCDHFFLQIASWTQHTSQSVTHLSFCIKQTSVWSLPIRGDKITAKEHWFSLKVCRLKRNLTKTVGNLLTIYKISHLFDKYGGH